MHIKEYVSVAAAVIGSGISAAFGGWGAALTTLVICMIIDYLTGLTVALVFKASTKTDNGGAESRAGFKGLCRKIAILAFVLVGARIDIIITGEGTFLRDAICIGFILNEVLSIVENCGLMGIPMPKAVRNAIAVLKTKAGEDEKKAEAAPEELPEPEQEGEDEQL